MSGFIFPFIFHTWEKKGKLFWSETICPLGTIPFFFNKKTGTLISETRHITSTQSPRKIHYHMLAILSRLEQTSTSLLWKYLLCLIYGFPRNSLEQWAALAWFSQSRCWEESTGQEIFNRESKEGKASFTKLPNNKNHLECLLKTQIPRPKDRIDSEFAGRSLDICFLFLTSVPINFIISGS